ncbi:alpha/beta fold hydrolase [Coleofasciculus sp. E1-EBD-02]|uniref:alpha/beta fold hydrolase n=1 Tax=Coleofasciculus sp. E1-EBD-02 TaxID=3068481 RepID=UPI0032F8C3A8
MTKASPTQSPETIPLDNRHPSWLLKSGSFLQQVSQSLCNLVDKPALILWGDRDPAFRASQRLRFQQVFPKSKTVILSGAGHFVQEDAVNQIVEALRLFGRGCRR